MDDAKQDDRELSVQCAIDAPPGKVWEIMTTRLAEWWCPRPWMVEIVEMDWRAGGRSAMIMRGPDGEEMPQEGIFLEVSPGRRFVTTDAVTHDMHPQGPFMIGIWEVAPQGEGTLYRASARHWTDDARRTHAEMGFAEGWAACARQLKQLVETGAVSDAGA
ncbi:activator of HSP90 ATPase [Sphingobium jiangsuense]|nr:SRPBCC domain-containing protein [Sphingobium jiangsuense]GLS99873.1 activator of HSP90 ATPase [Sphingobium jiangsuense]